MTLPSLSRTTRIAWGFMMLPLLAMAEATSAIERLK
jgi:hypothetical protein